MTPITIIIHKSKNRICFKDNFFIINTKTDFVDALNAAGTNIYSTGGTQVILKN